MKATNVEIAQPAGKVPAEPQRSQRQFIPPVQRSQGQATSGMIIVDSSGYIGPG